MTTLLLVAEDRQSLRATEATLWRHRESIEINVAASFEAATELLETRPIDIIACDTELGNGVGFELLESVSQASPSTIRVGICAAAQADSLVRAVSVAHRCIYRPWRPSDFDSMITRLIDLRESVGLDVCQRLSSGSNDVPPVPRVYTQLVAQLSREDVELDRVTSLISRDVGLASSLLRVVNSVLFGLSREITSIREAILYLGLNTVRDVVLSDEALRLVDEMYSTDKEQTARLRKRAAHTAPVARELAKKTRFRDAAFLAGLMHILGPLVGHEAELAPENSAALGGYVLGLWGITEPVVHAVARHVAPSDEDLEHPTLAALFVALKLLGVATQQGPQASSKARNTALNTLKLDPTELARIKSEFASLRSQAS
jgi:HD-like signal output (HDOD) protein